MQQHENNHAGRQGYCGYIIKTSALLFLPPSQQEAMHGKRKKCQALNNLAPKINFNYSTKILKL